MMMQDLVSANIFLLDQAERLLTDLEDQVYAEPDGNVFSSSLGQHLRHCLDHYASFLNGLPFSKIDYDHRERNPDLECLTACAITEVERLRQGLVEAAGSDVHTQVAVKMDCGGGDQAWHQSTLGRELQFLVSHSVHHFAMINGMCRERGLSTEEGFGIAPSTLQHRKLANIG